MGAERINVTKEFTRFRDLLRFSWNLLVAENRDNFSNYGLFTTFHEFQTAMLRLVFYYVAHQEITEVREIQDLQLYSESAKSSIFYPALSEPNGYCMDSPISLPPGTQYRILDFFDWTNMAVWDLQYTIVRVDHCSLPEWIGKQGIIESRWVEAYSDSLDEVSL